MPLAPIFHGFDGLMSLSRREGVDIRPTLLRVLTDLYVQSPAHSHDEERQFVELTSRLIDDVDDATRAMVRTRLATYPGTPREIRRRLGISPGPFLRPANGTLAEPDTPPIAEAPSVAPEQAPSPLPVLSMKPQDASSLNEMFLAASSRERSKILDNLNDAPLKPSVRVDVKRAAHAMAALEQAAMVADMTAFASELGDALILPAAVARQIVFDPLGEPLACAMKALGMPGEIFQRVLLFLNPAIGSSVMDVYRLARMYDILSERAALIMLAAWRGSSIANTRAKYRAALYDDERHRARPTQTSQPAAQPASDPLRRDTAGGTGR